jgi:hypothetical protein
MGKMFQNASSLKPLGQLKPNCPGMIIGRSSVFYANRKSKMAATTGHSINTEPYGENTEIYSSLSLPCRVQLKFELILTYAKAISIFSNSKHLEWRTGLSDTILKGLV